MAVPPPPDGRANPTATTLVDSNAASPKSYLVAPPNGHLPISRDPLTTRGRALSATSPQNASPRSNTPATQARAKHSFDIERKPSQTYGHHRQTSIVHGVQHSRNTSLLAANGTSPLSPHKATSNGIVDASSPGSVQDLRKSPSVSTLPNGTFNGATRVLDSSPSQRRPERMHSGRVRRSHEQQGSQSRTQGHPLQLEAPQELRTAGEYALHHLFTSFIFEADERIERCMPRPGEQDPRIETICGPGADPAFDQLISSLGYINRHKPKPLIDAVINWRKKKNDFAHSLVDELDSMRESVNITQRTATNGSFSTPASPPSGQDVLSMERSRVMAERGSGISVYILCRVLIEVIGQTKLQYLNEPDHTDNTAAKLENIIYDQLFKADPESIDASSLRRATWVIRGQLLGVMSGLRFEEVAGMFIKDLERAQKKLSVKGATDAKLAEKTAMLVRSMRWLKVRSDPEDRWEKSCDVLHTLAKFFADVRGRPMKHAYSFVFEQLLLPVAATATSELNMPRWKDVLATVQPKIAQMLSKADHWFYVFPLQAVLLCVSPAEQYATQWLQLIHSSQPKARDRVSRSHALKAICRLVWRYLYRLNDSQNLITKKLEEIVKLVFQGGKRILISTDPIIADPLIQLIRIIGYKHQDFCFRTIIFPLMNSELFSGPEAQLKIDNLDPEKTVIAIRAFLAVMADLEKGEAPLFPTTFECDTLMDPSSRSSSSHKRTKSQGFTVSAGRTERLSRPVLTSNLTEVAKEYYVKFCKILGRLTIICDNTFGGQAVLDEKFATHTPKTPMAEAFTFNKRDDLMNPTDLRQHYYDLLHVAVEALPRCLSPHLPINSLVNLLCTGTAHVQPHIAKSSVQSLKSIARQSHAQQVTIGFARFIFRFDDRYATVSDGSLLGPGHIESTLELYVELLQIWIDDIQRRTRKAVVEPNEEEDQSSRQLPLDLSAVLAHVDEIESHGLFFLCSPSRAVRAIAVDVLRLIKNFDTALGKPCTRIISILEGSTQEVININNERFSPAERSRLQKGLRKSNVNSSLVELCSSDITHDTNLWFKLFPNLVRLSSQICLHAVALTRELVCQRLSHSYRTICGLAEGSKQTSYEQPFHGRQASRFNSSSPDIIIEQWKIHLVFACTTLTNIGSSNSQPPKSSQSSQHTRKSSKSSSTSQEKIASAFELFITVVPFLSVSNGAVRNAAVIGLGATNATLFHTLLQSLHNSVQICTSDASERLASYQRAVSSPRRHRDTDHLRTEITHLLSLTCTLLRDPSLIGDVYALNFLTDFAKYVRLFLSDTEVQGELKFQKLRTHYCTLIEALYDCTRKLKDSSHWMSFQSRQATFALMESWCGFSPNEAHIRRQEDQVKRTILDREQDYRNRGIINSAIEKEKSDLQNAALSAMATLCAGPLSFIADKTVITDKTVLMQFDVRRLFSWISSMFETLSDRTHAIGRRALQNLMIHNPNHTHLMAPALRKCYVVKLPKALASYFDVVVKVLTDADKDTTPFWRILCAGLYTLGNDNGQVRMQSARLLRTLEERQDKTSRLQDLDISVSDKTTAVYKLAQFEISRRLAKQHQELAFHVFSEFTAYFNDLEPDHQRNMVSAMLPWIQTIELQLDPTGGPTATSYMLLVNLFEVTVRSSIALHNEVQALWQALATGPYGGNVQLVLDFIITICQDRNEQSFVIYAKQIVVFLSKTPAGARVVEYLLLHINPRTMVSQRRELEVPPTNTVGLPYIADLALALPSGGKQNGLSLGQLCMMLLVDLVVSPVSLRADDVPALLQVILVQWDQYAGIVQDQARELLVHLIHELVISKIESQSTEPDKRAIEDFVESVRHQDPKILWSYADNEVTADHEDSRAVSDSMAYVVDEVVRIFAITYPGIRDEWGKNTMTWAASCPVRHIACRSLQIYRCLRTTVDNRVLAEMVTRLSNTIADVENHEVLVFSLEILTTLRRVVSGAEDNVLPDYPQIFWTTCACLDTIFEREFQEALRLLDLLLTKLDLSDPVVFRTIRDSQPAGWQGTFHGLQALIYKGVRSNQSMDISLALMERLIKLPSSDIVGGDERLCFTILANLPRYLDCLEDFNSDTSALESAQTLAAIAESQGSLSLSQALQGFANCEYRNAKDFLSQCLKALKATDFPTHEFQSLVFLLGMVNNRSSSFKVRTMQVLGALIPVIDMQKPEIVSQGPDLISPLLRLLQTEHCQQALDVLDNVIDMTGTPMDNKHLRMSMAGSHSSRATRKEYENTKSLYGIPEESGWSVPMPAFHSAQTRANLHAVHQALMNAGSADLTATSSPDIEFHQDEYHDSYLTDRTATMMSDDTRIDGNMGELALKLDSLDDFFDEQTDAISPDLNGMIRYPSGLPEDRENLYDAQALPILRRSLTRNASVNSFQTGFAELRYHPAREPSVMNPAAFAQNGSLAVRPGLHNRSITSPVMTTKKRSQLQNDIMSGDEAGDETDSFSDDEISIGRIHTADEPYYSQNTVKPAGFKAGFRQGLRRLTSSSGSREAREALKAVAGASAKSPRVPKVPMTFLKDPMSGEL